VKKTKAGQKCRLVVNTRQKKTIIIFEYSARLGYAIAKVQKEMEKYIQVFVL